MMDFCSVTGTPNFPYVGDLGRWRADCYCLFFLVFLVLAVKRYYRYGIGIRILDVQVGIEMRILYIYVLEGYEQ